MKRLGVAATVVVVMIASAAVWLGGASVFPSVEPDLPPLATVQRTADLVLPLDSFQVSAGDSAALDGARRRLTASCAARFGIVSTEPSSTEPPRERNARRYGILPGAPVQTDGYRIPEGSDGAVQPAQWRPGTAETSVLFGITATGGQIPDGERPRTADGATLPAGGCAAEARRAMSGELDWDAGLPERLDSEAFALAERDSRTRTAWQEWATCMSGRGHSYASPWEPNDQRWGPQPDKAEIATATDDLGCRQQTRLVDIWFAVESAYQQEIVADNRVALENWHAALNDRVQRADAALSAIIGPP